MAVSDIRLAMFFENQPSRTMESGGKIMSIDLGTIEQYCQGENCGDPVTSGFGSQPAFTPRRLIFTGWKGIVTRLKAVYRCPRCGCERHFAEAFFSQRYVLVSSYPCRHHR